MTSSSAPDATPSARHRSLRPLVSGGLLLVLAGWALGPVSSKAWGWSWLALCALALLAWQGLPRHTPQAEVFTAARRWWWATTAAMVLAGAALAWHRDPLSSLQDNARLWLAAGAVLLLLQRLAFPANARFWLMGTCALACSVSAAVALSHDRDALPGNAIPWAVSVALLLCVLAPAVLDRHTDWVHRRWWAVGLLLGLVAVLVSQTRGALVIAAWLAWLLLHHLWVHRPQGAPRSLAALMAALLLLGSSAWWDSDPLRLREAGRDVGMLVTRHEPDSAVGSRLEMWSTAAAGIAESPWLGHGIRERQTAMRELGAQHAPRIWAELTHFHNEYLNAWFDHGLPGLAAVLLTLAGLLAAAHALRRTQAVAHQQLLGLAVVHGVAGLTNVNTAHNLYTLGLALAATAVLLGAGTYHPTLATSHSTP